MISDANRELGTKVCSRYGCFTLATEPTEMGARCIEHARVLMFPIRAPYERTERRFVFDVQQCPTEVPWAFVSPHEKQARTNHGGQTLARLSERGGLSVCEALAVVNDREWYEVDQTKAIIAFKAKLAEWEASRT